MAALSAGTRRWALAGLLGAGLVVIVWGMEKHFLYFPTHVLSSTPERLGLSAEALELRTDDGVRLRGWRLRGGGKTALLYFHGNAGNAGDRLDRARIMVERLGLDVFLVDYRGYGLSEGEPSESGLYRDARAIDRAARERGFAPESIVLFGESLGSAVAVHLAAEAPRAGVVLETPFLSIDEMARVHYPFVPRFLVRSRYDNAAKIARVAAPKLFSWPSGTRSRRRSRDAGSSRWRRRPRRCSSFPARTTTTRTSREATSTGGSGRSSSSL